MLYWYLIKILNDDKVKNVNCLVKVVTYNINKNYNKCIILRQQGIEYNANYNGT